MGNFNVDDRIQSFMQRKEDEFPELRLNPDILIRRMTE